jgi:putative hemolysin
MLKTFLPRAALCAVVVAAFSVGAGRVQAAGPDAKAIADTSAAAAYCTQTGGTVYWRQAQYNTNGGTPLDLSAVRPFCQYTSSTDGSTIHIFLDTLYTTKPTLAALAYYAAPATGTCEGNPASCYCTLLGGSDLFGGVNAAGGGWVNDNSVIQVLESCIFPDLSSIDSWGLAYHANGVIRGINLATVMRYPDPY